MTFDPTTNYGEHDLSVEENVVLWKFGELIKTLVTLSGAADKQMEIIGYGAVADEMAEDFNTYFTLSYQSYVDTNLLTSEQLDKLQQLDSFFEERNGDKAPDFWDDFQLATNRDWELVRQQARTILQMLNMADLMIEYDREENYESTDKGRQLMLQSTKTRLVRKNDS